MIVSKPLFTFVIISKATAPAKLIQIKYTLI